MNERLVDIGRVVRGFGTWGGRRASKEGRGLGRSVCLGSATLTFRILGRGFVRAQCPPWRQPLGDTAPSFVVRHDLVMEPDRFLADLQRLGTPDSFRRARGTAVMQRCAH